MVLNIIAVVIEAIGFILVLIIIALWAAYASVVSTCTTSDTGCWCTVNEKREAVSGILNFKLFYAKLFNSKNRMLKIKVIQIFRAQI